MTTATDPSDLDDHALAAWLADAAGERLLEVRQQGLVGRELKDAGDQAAQAVLARLLAEHRPDDAVLSEEAADDKARLTAHRVWIIDPLDGTREFSEPPRDDWAVHVALWEDGGPDGGRGGPAIAGRDVRHRAPTRRTSADEQPAPDRGLPYPPAGVRRRRSPRRSTPSWCRWDPPGSR